MSNRMDVPAPERRRRLPEHVAGDGSRGWTGLDYAAAMGFAASFLVFAPVLALPPFWISLMMAPPD